MIEKSSDCFLLKIHVLSSKMGIQCFHLYLYAPNIITLSLL